MSHRLWNPKGLPKYAYKTKPAATDEATNRPALHSSTSHVFSTTAPPHLALKPSITPANVNLAQALPHRKRKATEEEKKIPSASINPNGIQLPLIASNPNQEPDKKKQKVYKEVSEKKKKKILEKLAKMESLVGQTLSNGGKVQF